MALIDVTFFDRLSGSELNVELRTEITGEQAIQKLININFIPSLDQSPNCYLLVKSGGTAPILLEQTLGDAGVISGDTIHVVFNLLGKLREETAADSDTVVTTSPNEISEPIPYSPSISMRDEKAKVTNGINVSFDFYPRGTLYAELDKSLTVEEIIRLLYKEKFLLPRPEDQHYVLVLRNKLLSDNLTLESADVMDNDQIDVVIAASAGGNWWVDVLTITASTASVMQVILMIIDMWSRRDKKRKANKKKEDTDLAWNEVEFVSVQMSDGYWIKMDAWRHEPHKVKEFIDVFYSTQGSPKPILVSFYLESGSRINFNVSDEPENQKLLEALIEELKK